MTPSPVVTYAATRPLEVTPALKQVMRGNTTICSIYPGECRKTIRHDGRTVYTLPAAPRGSYSTLTVYDTQEWCARVDPIDGKPTWLPMPIPSMIVAQDLVQSWAGNTIGKRSGYTPGIAIITGDVPTPEELQTMRDGQTSLFQWYIQDANGKHIQGRATEITDIHRLAAKELLDKGAERLIWYPKIDFTAVKDCLACGKQIADRAKVCPDCGTNLVDWYIKYNLDTSADPAIARFMEQMRPVKAEVKATEPRVVTKG